MLDSGGCAATASAPSVVQNVVLGVCVCMCVRVWVWAHQKTHTHVHTVATRTLVRSPVRSPRNPGPCAHPKLISFRVRITIESLCLRAKRLCHHRAGAVGARAFCSRPPCMSNVRNHPSPTHLPTLSRISLRAGFITRCGTDVVCIVPGATTTPPRPPPNFRKRMPGCRTQPIFLAALAAYNFLVYLLKSQLFT